MNRNEKKGVCSVPPCASGEGGGGFQVIYGQEKKRGGRVWKLRK